MFCVLIVLQCFAAVGSAYAEVIDSGSCGDNLSWTLDCYGTLTISGEGDMYDFDDEYAPWKYLKSEIEAVVIENGVTSIGKEAFYQCSNIKSVLIPGSIAVISDTVFSPCSGMENILVDESNPNFCSLDGVLFNKSMSNLIYYPAKKSAISYEIPDSVTTVGCCAFYNCSILKEVTIPQSVKVIESAAFRCFRSIVSIEIPASVEDIGYDAFSNCDSLESIWVDTNNLNYTSEEGVLFNKSMTEIIQYPANKSGTHYTVPNTVESIAECSFEGSVALVGISIPNCVKSIGNYAFMDCSALTDIKIPNGISIIEYGVFYGCDNLTSVTLPGSVVEIMDDAFFECVSLNDIYYYGTEEDWDCIYIGNRNKDLNYAEIHFLGAEASGPSLELLSSLVSASGIESGSLLIVASYANYKLIDTKIIPISSDVTISISETGLDTNGAVKIKAFLWSDTNSTKSLCKSKSAAVN